MAVRKRKKRVYGTAKEMAVLNELCSVFHNFDIETRLERGKFRGGICTIEGDKQVLFLNKNHGIERNITLLIEELKKLEYPFSELGEDVRSQLHMQ